MRLLCLGYHQNGSIDLVSNFVPIFESVPVICASGTSACKYKWNTGTIDAVQAHHGSFAIELSTFK